MMEVNPTSHQHEANMSVEEVYEEDVEGDMTMIQDNESSVLRYEEEEDHSDGDEYGGMPIDLYNNIVNFKRAGVYPPNLNSRQDRSAASHWRSRCMRFVLADDNETLLYYNPASSVNDQAKVVVKKGEVRRVLERIHELIGHLGQKRTQMVVLKKLHWRSVRQDVKTFIVNCSFCNQKKLEGKKILKAPVDISSEHFGINIEVRSKGVEDNGDRLSFSLIGYNEHEVHAAAMSRMTTYTFKETANDIRGARYIRTPKNEYAYGAGSFRRQPYIKRSRCGSYASSYILPYTPKGNRDETEFIVFPDPRNPTAGYSGEHVEEDDYGQMEELVDTRPSTSSVMEQLHRDVQQNVPDSQDNDSNSNNVEDGMKPDVHSMPLYYEPNMKRINTANRRRKNKFLQGSTGTAARFSITVGGGNERMDLSDHTAELLTPLDGAQNRPELIGLAPIMLLPSVDPEVIQMQKELLTRQLKIQALQEKVLQSQYESMRIPIARYEEIDPRGDRIQLLSHVDQEIIEETVDIDQDLNVIDSDNEEDIDVMKRYTEG